MKLSIPPHDFILRHYQKPMWRAIHRDKLKSLFLTWHRRCGKDTTVFHSTVLSAIHDPGYYVHMLPTQRQARKVIWDARTGEGIRLLDWAIPRQLRLNTNNTEMKIELAPTVPGKDGSIIQLMGSDNYDSNVGTNFKQITYSEFALTKPASREYFTPILAENGGREVIITTPRGRNHAHRLWQAACANPDVWFTQSLDITQTKRPDGTPVITEEAIAKERADGKPEAFIQQEYYVDWTAATIGAIYADLMEQARVEGRIGAFPHIEGLPVETVWDLGVSKNNETSIIFFQRTDSGPRIIDYYEAHGQGIDHYAEVVHSKPYWYETHWAPHDIKVRGWAVQGAATRQQIAREKYGIEFKVVKSPKAGERGSLIEGIQILRSILPTVSINQATCKAWLDAMDNYQWQWDDEKKAIVGSKPLHDWSSNGADAGRYMGLALTLGGEDKASDDAVPVMRTHRNSTVDDLIGSLN